MLPSFAKRQMTRPHRDFAKQTIILVDRLVHMPCVKTYRAYFPRALDDAKSARHNLTRKADDLLGNF